MPEIVESFEDLKEHASYCHLVLYRIDPMAEGKFRVRVQAGRFGYDKALGEKEAKEIELWLKSIDAIKVVGSVAAEVFFS